VLARLFNLNGHAALSLCSKLHDRRQHVIDSNGLYISPETHEQRDQVYRIVDKLYAQKQTETENAVPAKV
jgi:hypothetical protein